MKIYFIIICIISTNIINIYALDLTNITMVKLTMTVEAIYMTQTNNTDQVQCMWFSVMYKACSWKSNTYQEEYILKTKTNNINH